MPRLPPPPCPACGGLLDGDLAVPDSPFSILRCPACGAGATWPRPDGPALAELYAAYHRGGKGRLSRLGEWLVGPFKRDNARGILRRLPRGRVLDVGYGRGDTIRFLAARGLEGWGVEIVPSDLPRSAGAVPGAPVLLTGRFPDVDLPPESFDGVSLFHVLEHLPDPGAALAAAHRLLRGGGLLFLSVPAFDGLQARLFGRRWFHLDPPFHLFHFTRRSLELLAARAGFEPIEIRPGGLDQEIFGWAQGFLNAARLPKDFLFDLLRGEIAPRGAARALTLLLHALHLPPAALLAAALTVLERLGGRPGSLWVVLKKTPEVL